MKNAITTTMFTTGSSLVILAVYFLIVGEREMGILRIIEIFGANVVINIGIHLRHKFEIKNIIIDYIVDVSYISAVLMVFGVIFDWHSSIHLWLLPAMAFVIYLFAIISTVVKIEKDTKEINDLLQKRKEKKAEIVS